MVVVMGGVYPPFLAPRKLLRYTRLLVGEMGVVVVVVVSVLVVAVLLLVRPVVVVVAPLAVVATGGHCRDGGVVVMS